MIETEKLLQPISEQSECGEYLAYDYSYDQIKEYMREDDPRLSQGVWQIDIKKANWEKAIESICDLLIHKTKDLQLVTWLVEALISTDGLSGLINGLEITLEMSKKFWDKIYPTDDDNHRRLMPFVYLNEKILNRLVFIKITEEIDTEHGAFTLSDLMQAQYNFQIKNFSGISLKDIRKSFVATSYDFLHNQNELIEKIFTYIKQLEKFLDEKYANEAPSFRKIVDRLNAIKHETETALKTVKPAETQIEPVETIDEISEEDDEDKPIVIEEDIKNTSDELSVSKAYELLDKIATFLEKEQPQSPASILIKMARTIGAKSFQELLDLNMNSGVSVMNTISELYKILVSEKNITEETNNNENNSQMHK